MDENLLNRGYKTLKAKEVGPHVKVGYDLIKSKDISPTAKIVYAYLKSFENKNTHTAIASMDLLVKKSGYHKSSIVKSLKILEEYGVIEVCKKSSSKHNGRFYNTYRFKIGDDMFAMITITFIESTILSRKEKEFLVMILPILLKNNTIGSLEKPATVLSISKDIGLTYRITKDRIDSLTKKGLITEWFTKKNTAGVSYYVGFHIEMTKIMLDALHVIREERNKYKEERDRLFEMLQGKEINI